MIYTEIFKAIVSYLIASNLLDKETGDGANSNFLHPLSDRSLLLTDPKQKIAATQVLRLSTLAQIRHINSVASKDSTPLAPAELLTFMDMTDNTFSNFRLSSQLDNLIESWFNTVVSTYITSIAPAWVVPLTMIINGPPGARPNLMRLLTDYTDTSSLSINALAKWKNLKAVHATDETVSLNSIRDILLNSTPLRIFTSRTANQSINASHYLPYRMLSGWVKYEKSISYTATNLDRNTSIMSLVPIDMGSQRRYDRKPVTPIAQSRRFKPTDFDDKRQKKT